MFTENPRAFKVNADCLTLIKFVVDRNLEKIIRLK